MYICTNELRLLFEQKQQQQQNKQKNEKKIKQKRNEMTKSNLRCAQPKCSELK